MSNTTTLSRLRLEITDTIIEADSLLGDMAIDGGYSALYSFRDKEARERTLLHLYLHVLNEWLFDEDMLCVGDIRNILVKAQKIYRESTCGKVATVSFPSCPKITFSSVTATGFIVSWTSVPDVEYYKYVVTQQGSQNIFTELVADLTFSRTELIPNTLYTVTVTPAIPGMPTCPPRSVRTSSSTVQLYIEWAFLTEDPEDLEAINFTQRQVLTPGASASIPVTDMPPNVFMVIRYPASEADFATWFNTTFNYGTISAQDQVFGPIIEIDTSKYVKSRIDFTLDPNAPLVLAH